VKTFTKNSAKLVLLTASLLLMFFYNTNSRHLRSIEQSKYERWLQSFSAEKNPDLTLTLTLPGNKGKGNRLQIKGVSAETQSNILRILTLAREAQLFHFKNRQEAQKSLFTFNVETEDASFKTNFSMVDIEDNAQARTLLALFRLFSEDNTEETHLEITTAKTPRENL